MKRVWWVAVAVLGSLLMTSCGGGGGSVPSASVTPSTWPQPTGSPVVLAPVTGIDGAQAQESDGVAFQLPQGWQTRREQQGDVVRIHITDSSDQNTYVLVTVQGKGDADAVAGAASSAFAQFAVDGATDLEQHPASWDGWKYATAITGRVDVSGSTSEFMLVVALSGSGTVVGVSAQTPGSLQGSLVEQVLRSVRAAR